MKPKRGMRAKTTMKKKMKRSTPAKKKPMMKRMKK